LNPTFVIHVVGSTDDVGNPGNAALGTAFGNMPENAVQQLMEMLDLPPAYLIYETCWSNKAYMS
jgi:hypothetical protein